MKGKERLELALAHFRKIPAFILDMDYWCLKVDCGTTYCFCGWATQDPLLKWEGFSILGENYHELIYGESKGMDAAARFFDIPYKDAQALFTSVGEPGEVPEWWIKDYVVSSVEDYLKNHDWDDFPEEWALFKQGTNEMVSDPTPYRKKAEDKFVIMGRPEHIEIKLRLRYL